jgi:hypothetical protein
VIKTNTQANLRVTSGMYRGVATKTLQTASSNFIYFYIYSWISSWKKEKSSALTRLLLSAIAAMLNTCLTLPLDVLSAKQQTQQGATVKMDQAWKAVGQLNVHAQTGMRVEDEKKDDTAPQQQQALVPPDTTGTEHWTVLWKGLMPSLLLCTNPSIHYTVFDIIKTRILQRQSDAHTLTMGQAFLVGLLAKFVATISTYPLIRTKIILMVTTEKSMFQCLRGEYQQDGIRGLYRGCYLQLFHTLLKSALLMMVRERITDATHQLLAPTHQ